MGSESNDRKVVMDAGAAIKLQRLERLGSELFTTSGVFAEVKDEKARALLGTLPMELQIKEPLPQDIAFTRQFAKSTGDFGFLSRNDLDLIALTVRLHREAGGPPLREKPAALSTQSEAGTVAFDWGPSTVQKASKDEGSEAAAAPAVAAAEKDKVAAAEGEAPAAPAAEEEDDAGEWASVPVKGRRRVQEPEPPQVVEENEDGEEEDDLSEDGSSAGEWVTSDNIHRFGVGIAPGSEVKVTCATSDYSVQNVLLQMGITPLTFDGYAVQNVKMWGLICRACFHFTRESTKVFCPKCGHDTLVRVPIVVGQDGKPTALNAGRKLRTKGTVFSIPKPQGGRGWKPLMAEDEIKLGGRDREMRRLENLADKERKAKDPFDEDNGARGWWQRGTTNTGKMLTGQAPRMQAGYGRRNPNANNFGGFKKGKK